LLRQRSKTNQDDRPITGADWRDQPYAPRHPIVRLPFVSASASQRAATKTNHIRHNDRCGPQGVQIAALVPSCGLMRQRRPNRRRHSWSMGDNWVAPARCHHMGSPVQKR
jgi:hypothetical protein